MMTNMTLTTEHRAVLLAPEDIHVGMTVWVEAYAGGVAQLAYEGSRPYGVTYVCHFSDGTMWTAHSYLYRWRCWSEMPSMSDRQTPWLGVEYAC